MAATYPMVLTVPLPYVFLEQFYHYYRFSSLPVRLSKNMLECLYWKCHSFSFMIPKSLRSTIYAWMIFERQLLHLWMLLLWLSWTRWVWRHERVVADLLHFSTFLNNYLFPMGCRCSTGGWSIVIWLLDSVHSSPKQKSPKYCGRLSTTPGKTMTKSW